MKLHLFWYECKNCKKIFKSPELCGDGYGECLFLDECGNMAYLNSFSDMVFNEVSVIFDKVVLEEKFKNIDYLFPDVLRMVCDRSPSNKIYSLRKPLCSICKKSNFSHFGPTNPPEIIEMDIPNATHNTWNKLSIEEKKQCVSEAIKVALDNENLSAS